jgi:hypothetical protein
MAEDHALINRLQQVRAGVQRLHAVKAAGHLQPGVAAIEKRQEEHIAFGFRQAGDGLVDLMNEMSPHWAVSHSRLPDEVGLAS